MKERAIVEQQPASAVGKVSLLQRKRACGGSANAGERPQCLRKNLLGERPPLVQAKLVVNQTGDLYEKEADRAADQVMRMGEGPERPGVPLRRAAITQDPSRGLQRESIEDEDEEDQEEGLVQTKQEGQRRTTSSGDALGPPTEREELCTPGRSCCARTRVPMESRIGHSFAEVSVHFNERPAASGQGESDWRTQPASSGEDHVSPNQPGSLCGERDEGTWKNAVPRMKGSEERSRDGAPDVAPGTVTRIDALRGGGRPLDPRTREFMESRFGRDLGSVRIHTTSTAADLASSIHARAFTIGRDIVFGAGQYSPESAKGKRLLAHELTHVAQQRGGLIPSIQRDPEGKSGPIFSAAIRDQMANEILKQRRDVREALEGRVRRHVKKGELAELTPRSRKPYKGHSGLPSRHGRRVRYEPFRTFAQAAIVKPDGTIRGIVRGSHVHAGAAHAEEVVLKKLQARVKPGDTVIWVIDQLPCGGKSNNCSSQLRNFPKTQKISQRVFVVTAAVGDAPDVPGSGSLADLREVSGKAGPRKRLYSPKSYALGESGFGRKTGGRRAYFEITDYQRVRLPVVGGPSPVKLPGIPEPSVGSKGKPGGSSVVQRPDIAPDQSASSTTRKRKGGLGAVPDEGGGSNRVSQLAGHIVAGVLSSLVTSEMLDQLRKLPKVQRDPRTVAQILRDPAMEKQIRLIDLLGKDVDAVRKSVKNQSKNFGWSVVFELGPIFGSSTMSDESRADALSEVDDRLESLETDLETIQLNLGSIIEREKQLMEFADGVDTSAVLLTAAGNEIVVQMGVDVDTWAEWVAGLERLAKSARNLPAKARALEGDVNSLLEQIRIYREIIGDEQEAITKLRLGELIEGMKSYQSALERIRAIDRFLLVPATQQERSQWLRERAELVEEVDFIHEMYGIGGEEHEQIGPPRLGPPPVKKPPVDVEAESKSARDELEEWVAEAESSEGVPILSWKDVYWKVWRRYEDTEVRALRKRIAEHRRSSGTVNEQLLREYVRLNWAQSHRGIGGKDMKRLEELTGLL